jgi:AcrR family transcriptional regulator
MTPTNAQAGLRERKKARTRASLREHALRLFREKGYQETTVEQIAAAAEVSPSTFFRYFPTKEDVVLQDDMDVRMLDAFSRQPASLTPVAAIRAATKEALTSFGYEDMAQIRELIRLTLTVPEIRARAMDEFARTIEVLAEALGKRAGRPPDDTAVRTLAGAVVGVIMSATIPWQERLSEQSADEMFAGIDKALALLEAGLPLLSPGGQPSVMGGSRPPSPLAPVPPDVAPGPTTIRGRRGRGGRWGWCWRAGRGWSRGGPSGSPRRPERAPPWCS